MGVFGRVGRRICRISHVDFGEYPFHALGCVRVRLTTCREARVPLGVRSTTAKRSTHGVGCAGRLGRLLRGEEAGPVRVLIAIHPRMYGETLAYALSKNRPSAEVVRVEPGDLDGALEGFGPRLVVCNEATDEVRALAPSWVVPSYPRAVEADVCLGGRRSTIVDVRVEDVLVVMDEAERLSAAT